MSEHEEQKTLLGFWIYLMTDLLMFAGLFAAYAVLKDNTFGGVGGSDIFNLPFVLTETLCLLTSSFTCGIAIFAAQMGKGKTAVGWLLATFALGATFLGLELSEFAHLFQEGHTPQKSAFLSSYFALVGTHGLHICVGLLWMAVMLFVIFKQGLSAGNVRKLTLLGYFWHFLDIVWIFIFTIVYLMGVIV